MGKADDPYTPEERAALQKKPAAQTAEQRAKLDKGRKAIDRYIAIRDHQIPPPWAEKLRQPASTEAKTKPERKRQPKKTKPKPKQKKGASVVPDPDDRALQRWLQASWRAQRFARSATMPTNWPHWSPRSRSRCRSRRSMRRSENWPWRI